MSKITKPIVLNIPGEEKKLSEVSGEFYEKYKGAINKLATVILLGIIAIVGYDYYTKQQIKSVNEQVGKFYSAYYAQNNDIYSIGENIASTLKGVDGTASVLFLLANKYQDDNKIAEASKLYNTIIKNYDKKMEIVAFSYSKLAFILEDSDITKSSEIFTDLVKTYSTSPLVNVWKLELARINKVKNSKESIKLCKNIIENEKINQNIIQKAKNLLAEINYVN